MTKPSDLVVPGWVNRLRQMARLLLVKEMEKHDPVSARHLGAMSDDWVRDQIRRDGQS